MAGNAARLLRLAATLERLRAALAGQIAKLAAERDDIAQRRMRLEALMAAGTQFLDLTTPGFMRRLKEMSARASAIDAESARLRQRSAEVFLKAKRARQLAGVRQAQRDMLRAREELVDLATQPSSLWQGE